MVSGGTALVAASLVGGSQLLTPALGALFLGKFLWIIQIPKHFTHVLYDFYKGTTGATLVGGNMIAQNMCLGMYFNLGNIKV